MPPGSGAGLAQAIGVVTIQAQLSQAQQQIAQFSQQTQQQLGKVAASSNSAETALKQFAGALGIGAGVAGAVQLGKMAIAADQIATAYNRQKVAAEGLAGSQSKLNDLLDAYDHATGGAIDNAQALADVTKLMAVGMADNATELDRLVTAARGAAVAMGRTTQDVLSEIQLAVSNQSFRRLDQIGLSIDEVRARMDELKSSSHGMTTEAAFQQAVLDQLTKKYGGLAKSVEALPTGLENAQRALKDFRLEFGESTKGITNFTGDAFANWLKQTTIDLRKATDFLFDFGQAVGVVNRQLASPPMTRFASSLSGIDVGRHGGSGPASSGVNPNQTDIDKATLEWSERTQEIERQANKDRLSETNQYESQRTRSIAQYEENITRSASDFAKNRMRAQEDYENSILDIMRQAQQRELQLAADRDRTIARAQADSANRLADFQEQLDRTIAQKRADSADKIAGYTEDRDKDIADRRKDSADRLLDLEKDYARQQEDAARQHQTNRLEDAARLDARALFFEDRKFKDQQQAAADAHTEQVNDEKAKLQKSLDNINESYNEKLQDEQEALQKSIDQAQDAYKRQVDDEKEALAQRISDANEAYTQQLADAKAADAQRITDMASHFTAQKTREDADQVERMAHMAADHMEEMTQQATEHADRLTQIETQAGEERDQNDKDFQKQLDGWGVHTANSLAIQTEGQRLAEESFKAFWKNLNDTIIGGPVDTNDPLATYKRTLQASIDNYKLQQTQTSDPTEKARLQSLIDQLQTALDRLGITGPLPKPASASSLDYSMGASSYTPVAAPMGAMMGASNRSLAVTFAQGSIVINGVASDTAKELADMIDERFLYQIRTAAGRL